MSLCLCTQKESGVNGAAGKNVSPAQWWCSCGKQQCWNAPGHFETVLHYIANKGRITVLPEPHQRELCYEVISHNYLLEPLCKSFQPVSPKIWSLKLGTLDEPENQKEHSVSACCFQKPSHLPEIVSCSGIQLCTKDQGSPKEPKAFC